MFKLKIKKLIPLLLIIALVASLLTACGSQSSSTADNRAVVEETYAAGAPAVDMAEGGMSKQLAPDMMPAEPSGQIPNTNRKIIKNANLGMEVVDVKDTYNKLLAFAQVHKGYETGRNEYKSNDFLVLSATIRIDPTQLDAFIEYAGTVGELVNVQISSSDITESYYDAKTRLATMEKSLARYDEFMTRAQTIEEVLQVQAQINQITVEIESLKGMIRMWDSLLDESTITIEIRQVDDPVQIKKEIKWSALSWADMVYLMKSGLTRLTNVVVTTVQWLAIVIAVSTPVWLIALIIILVIRRKRGKAKKTALEKGAPVSSAPNGMGEDQKGEDKTEEKK